jgi:hypothetical protein
VKRETAVVKKAVRDAETPIMQKQDNMRNVETAGSTTTKPETTVQELLKHIKDSMSNLPSSNDDDNGKD